MTKQPENHDADHDPYASKSSFGAITTWINAELRDRVQSNGAALAEIHLARTDLERPARAAEPELEDREAEP
jgi:hypothetical protein